MGDDALTLVSGTTPNEPAPAPGTPAVVDRSWGSLRVSPRPFDHLLGGQFGFYRVTVETGQTTGLSSGALLYSFRWAAPNALAVLLRVSVNAVLVTAFGTAQAVDCDIVSVRGWTTSDTGGTAVSVLGNSNKQRSTNMAPSLISQGDLRVATASALGAGATKTPDANAFGASALSVGTVSGASGPAVDLYKAESNGSHPLVYAANEGFNIRLIKAQGATGVVLYYVTSEWAELVGF